MKTRKNIYFKVVALAVIAIALAMPASNSYRTMDMQQSTGSSTLR